ncbi:phage protein Gp36 family protein [Algiphilus sp.]|uniref:phage protein Gp36 family protein n=1 Tax=Algiphilus sp. TaxID=1872431 RepID=UPI0025C01AA4|nr:phage protein Gp36 family protein [Algiphilus sp.]MCK5772042.1 DUF1320 domain-containing protein [Algiphilus sp.]
MYLTPAQLADGQGARLEIAQLFELDVDLLAATLAGDDRSAWTADEIAAADATIVTIAAVITRADGEIDAHLAQRGYTLPMDPEQFPVLVTWSRAITRYHVQIQRDRTNEDTGRIERDYRDALRALRLVADGKLSLGAGDPLTPGSTEPSSVQSSSAPRRFSRAALRGQ